LLRGVLSGRGLPAQRMVGSLRLRAELTARLCQLAQLRRQGLLTAAESGAAMARLLGLDRARRKIP
jgi:hypothetical protein